MPPAIDQPVSTFHPYAKRLAAPLKRIGIATVRDLLRYAPVRHEDLRTIVRIQNLRQGQRVVIRGKIVAIANRRSPRRRMFVTEALLSDASWSIRCVWFQQPYLAHAFRIGDVVVVAGTVESDAYGLHLVSPIIERDHAEMLHTGRLVPIYPLTAGISQKQLRFLIHTALPFAAQFAETLSEDIREREQLLAIDAAIRQIHFPTDADALACARARLAFEEVFTYFLRVRASREELAAATAPSISIDVARVQSLIARIPFPLTNAQERAIREILSDISGDASDRARAPAAVQPMQRLLNGDVGSGKTVVAAVAAASVVRAGFQVAYLAPTEVLAVQHARTFARLLQPLGIRVALWTRALRAIDGEVVAPRVLAAAARGGSVGIVIGTHAILAERVRFHALGLAIIDEQHRFGVEQRAALRAKADDGRLPHLLSMTATPIPRTLALTAFGDLDVSVLDAMPSGRVPIRTVVIGPADRLAMTREIRTAIDRGHQVFVVCPKITETENDDVAAVTEAMERAEHAFPGVSVGMLHGRMRREEQRAAMDAFASRQVPMLVATTVIEVGVDCPNATVMVIEDAERFGLAQLHQLRGRVGRGSAPGMCFLTTRSAQAGTRHRLETVARCTDGFQLAERDLEERGPGALVGTLQSGWPAFRFAPTVPGVFRRAEDAAASAALRADAAAHLE